MVFQGILLLFFSLLCSHGLKTTEVPGGQFGKGSIDIGGLELRELSTFTKIWSPALLPAGGGGATFYSPSSLPSGFFPLGSHAQPNSSKPLSRRALIARDTSHSSSPSLAAPIDFTLLFSTNSSPSAHFWIPVPPRGYSAAGHLITSSPQKPDLSSLRCVRDDLLRPCEHGAPIWSTAASGSRFTVHLPESLDTFFVSGGGGIPFACLKTNALSLVAMPNLTQITSMIRTHAPWFHFHPDEPYMPSSVSWFFNNGALLYANSTPITHLPIDPAGEILPRGGINDGAYWLDLPVDPSLQQIVVAGNLTSAKAYIHVKPVPSVAATDIVYWLFYPFNGAASAKIEFVKIGLGRIGEHVGDWEHVTQRFSNFDGELKQMYFSQHSSGSWVDAADLEYDASGSRPAAYATLHGHAFYPNAGLVLKGEVEKGIGLMDSTATGGAVMDAAEGADVVAAEYLGVEEPPWLQYMREWGPKVKYDDAKELDKALRFLPGKLKKAARNLVSKLPPELLGEEGPTGPKEKLSWNGDES